MSSSTPDTFRAAVLTVSDSCARGERNDASGPAVARALQEHQFAIVETRVVADDYGAIQKAIVDLARKARLVVTTGGTGKKTPFALLSRGLCGVCGTSLVLNLPGSPAGAVESLQAVVDVLPHAIQILAGKTEHLAN